MVWLLEEALVLVMMVMLLLLLGVVVVVVVEVEVMNAAHDKTLSVGYVDSVSTKAVDVGVQVLCDCEHEIG